MVVCDVRTEKTTAAINEIAIANDMGNIPDVPFDNFSDLDLNKTLLFPLYFVLTSGGS